MTQPRWMDLRSWEENKKKYTDDPSRIFECNHEHTALRERTIRGGSKQYVNQCVRCGEPIGNPVKNPGIPLAKFDDELRESFAKRRLEAYKNAHNSKSTAWFELYEEYLNSPEWAAKRAAVLRRSHGDCEGCREQLATQVHHISYAHVTQELLFELVAVCDACHDIAHQE